MHEQKSVNGSTEIELLESDLLGELEAVRDALNGTGECEHHTQCKSGGRQACEEVCDEFDQLTDVLDMTFKRVKEMLLKVSS